MKFSIFFIFLISCFKTLDATDPDPFCKPHIIETQEIFETKSLRVLVDYAPRIKGHLLVIPKRHVVSAHELSKEEWGELGEVIPKIVAVFEKALNTNQYMIFEKNGPLAYQEIPHVHFHLMPVTEAGSWEFIFKNYAPPKLSKEQLQQEVEYFKKYFNKCMIKELDSSLSSS